MPLSLSSGTVPRSGVWFPLPKDLLTFALLSVWGPCSVLLSYFFLHSLISLAMTSNIISSMSLAFFLTKEGDMLYSADFDSGFFDTNFSLVTSFLDFWMGREKEGNDEKINFSLN